MHSDLVWNQAGLPAGDGSWLFFWNPGLISMLSSQASSGIDGAHLCGLDREGHQKTAVTLNWQRAERVSAVRLWCNMMKRKTPGRRFCHVDMTDAQGSHFRDTLNAVLRSWWPVIPSRDKDISVLISLPEEGYLLLSNSCICFQWILVYYKPSNNWEPDFLKTLWA